MVFLSWWWDWLSGEVNGKKIDTHFSPLPKERAVELEILRLSLKWKKKEKNRRQTWPRQTLPVVRVDFLLISEGAQLSIFHVVFCIEIRKGWSSTRRRSQEKLFPAPVPPGCSLVFIFPHSVQLLCTVFRLSFLIYVTVFIIFILFANWRWEWRWWVASENSDCWNHKSFSSHFYHSTIVARTPLELLQNPLRTPIS